MTVTEYLRTVGKDLSRGYATEHTHRPTLKAFIESLKKGIVATNEPRRIKCGAPDFIITKGHTPLGYIEAKDVGVSLDQEECSEQLLRYRESLANLILTDYLEFRWYVNGERRQTTRLATLDTKNKLHITKEASEQAPELLTTFLNNKIRSSRSGPAI